MPSAPGARTPTTNHTTDGRTTTTMAWVKEGDEAVFHPVVTESAALAPEGEHGFVNEVFGFVARCASYSARHLLDYYVPMGAALQIAGPRGHDIIDWAVKTGYMVRKDMKGHDGNPKPAVRIIEHEGLFHLRFKEEVERDRQDWKDRKSGVAAQIRARDGDQCRYCGKTVKPKDTVTARGQTLVSLTVDHLRPKTDKNSPKKFDSPEDGVVACRSCNSKIGTMPKEKRVKLLLEPPKTPLYGPRTVELLEEHGIPTDKGMLLVNDAAEGSGVKTSTPSNPAADASSTARSTPEGIPAPAGDPGAAQEHTGRPEGSSLDVDPAASSEVSVVEGSEGPSQDADPALGAPPPSADPPNSPEQVPSSFQAASRACSGQGPGRGGSGRDGSGREARPQGSSTSKSRKKKRRRRR